MNATLSQPWGPASRLERLFPAVLIAFALGGLCFVLVQLFIFPGRVQRPVQEEGLMISPAVQASLGSLRHRLRPASGGVDVIPAEQTRFRPLPRELTNAVEHGLATDVDALLSEGVDANTADPEGRLPLFLAARDGNPVLVRSLVVHGADPNRADAAGRTPMEAAIHAGSGIVAGILLAGGADPNGVASSGDPVLSLACARGDCAVVRELLGAGAIPNSPSAQGVGLMDVAFSSGSIDLVRMLLGNENVEARWSSAARDFFFTAIRAQNKEVLQTLIRRLGVAGVPTLQGDSLVGRAVAMGDLKQVEFLLDSGLSADAPFASPATRVVTRAATSDFLRHYLAEEEGITPLMFAAGQGNVPMVDLLLRRGAKRGAETRKYHLAPLTFAAKTSNTGAALLLLGRKPADANRDYIDISLTAQRAMVYLGGMLLFSTEISSGRPGFETKRGEFVVTDKQVQHMSTIYRAKMPYFMRLSCGDFGLHEGTVPGYPDSHGCVRVPAGTAQKLFKQVPIGTVVRIY